MNIILLGAPGAGKGTQAQAICNYFKIPHISTGDIIREALKNGTDMGKKAQTYMDEGRLVPDDVVIGIIKERVQDNDCKNGFVFDGFPRTIPQAQALDDMGIIIDKVIDIDVADDSIIKRMSGRRVCSVCGASFHIDYNMPKLANTCDICQKELIQRPDDNPSTVASRLQVYHEQTEPLINYYQKQNKVLVIDGNDSIDNITKKAIEALQV